MNEAIDRLERGDHAISPAKCVANAAAFSEGDFRDQIAAFVEAAYQAHMDRYTRALASGGPRFHPGLFPGSVPD